MRERSHLDDPHTWRADRNDVDFVGLGCTDNWRLISEVPADCFDTKPQYGVGDTALRLGHFFGTSGEFWLNLQKLYELRRAEQKNGAAIARLPALDDGDRLRA